MKEVRASLRSYYKHIAYISQESPVFDGTLRENIVFGESVGDDEITDALRQVCLSDFYAGLEKGLDTEIGERGVILSGGERQRLALARLWFSDANIVILDEATSALDNITENEVMRNVSARLRGRTLIITAHRIASLRGLDNCRIIAFAGGRIECQGSFDELLQSNEYFRRLYFTNSSGQFLNLT